jgi:hypothetical protein
MIVDDYINCGDLIKEANELYETAWKKEMSNDDRQYLISTNKYINEYQTFREKMIKEYIDDLKLIINPFMNELNEIILKGYISE